MVVVGQVVSGHTAANGFTSTRHQTEAILTCLRNGGESECLHGCVVIVCFGNLYMLLSISTTSCYFCCFTQLVYDAVDSAAVSQCWHCTLLASIAWKQCASWLVLSIPLL